MRVPVDKKVMVEWQRYMMEQISLYKTMYENTRLDNPAYLATKEVVMHLQWDLQDVQDKIRAGYYDINTKTTEPTGL